MGAGALPVDEHRRRPPIPIVPVDARARASALEHGLGDAAAWLAAVSGGRATAIRSRILSADPEALALPVRDAALEPAMTVGEVALAVDTGRELAAAASADGVTVVVATTMDPRSAGSAAAVAAVVTRTRAAALDAESVRAVERHEADITGPLGALRRLGTPAMAVLCGIALGAGERGMGCVCEGVAALAAGAVAAAIEPDLRARLIAAYRSPEPVHAALLEHLAVPVVLDAPAVGDATSVAERLDRLAALLAD